MIRNYEVQEIGEYSRLVGEENLRIVLDTFDCSLNQEVEGFLVRKAVQAGLLKSGENWCWWSVRQIAQSCLSSTKTEASSRGMNVMTKVTA